MISRTTDPALLAEATEPYRHELMGFEPEDWIRNPNNIALHEDENVSLFELGSDNIYTAHYFYVARGKHAKRIALETLDFLFENTPIEVLRGLTPLGKLGARWMNRQLGFKVMSAIDTPNGPCELIILTKSDYMKKRNG